MRRPLVGICIFFILGIGLAKFISVPFHFILILASASFICSFLFLKFNFNFFIFISFFLLGICIFENSEILPFHHIQKYIDYRGKHVVVKGIVDSDPIVKNSNYGHKTSFVFDAKEIKRYNKWRKTQGKVLVNSFQKQEFFYGEELVLEGKIYKVPQFAISEKFDYREYLRRKYIFGILSVKNTSPVEIIDKRSGNPIKKFSFRIRNKLRKQINNYFPSLESGLLRAMILGERQDIPKFIREIFIQTGTIHILAISGLHIGIIAFIILIFLKVLRVPRKPRYIITMLFLVLYVFITGSRVSVVRATIMFIILLGGFLFEREININNSLALACFLILGSNPNQLFDIGFQLSFISVFSIVNFSPKIEGCIYKIIPKKKGILFFILRSISVSLAVWLGVMGIIAYNFNILTPITILANLFIIPFMIIVLGLGTCFLFISLIFPSIAFIFANSSLASLFVLVKFTYFLSRLPGAYFFLPVFPLYFVYIYYFLLLSVFILSHFVSSRRVCE
ncbi:MAG: ComEC/Rec2 family competence protein [Candidatus Omnitrophota bacterium]